MFRLVDFLQALGVLPYIIALDHDTKSVVVAIRGSVSSADWVTDMLGVPEPLGDWLPDSFRRVSQSSQSVQPVILKCQIAGTACQENNHVTQPFL